MPESTKWKPIEVLGSTGLNQQGGIIEEEWLSQLKSDKGIKAYTEMKDNDPIIGSILYAIKTLIKQTEWRIEPTGEDEIHVQLADFVESCREDMSITWNDFLS